MTKCTFCGEDIEKGTGKLYITTAGRQINFCSRKCEKNQLKLKRKAIHVKWTKYFKK